MRYLSIDIETTGLNPEKHQMIEFAAVLTDTEDRGTPLKKLPFFRKLIHYDEYIGQPFALAMNSEIFRQLDKPLEQKALITSEKGFCTMFFAFLKKHGIDKNNPISLAGKNVGGFDYQFLHRMFDYDVHIKGCFNYRFIDPTILYYEKTDSRLPSINDCMTLAGTRKGRKPHEAYSDALDIIYLLRKGL